MNQVDFKEKVLLVDDEPQLLEILAGQLKDVGIHVVSAKSGKEALELYEHNDVFLIISDLKMPEMDGNELCMEVRKLSPSIPFILLTAYGDKDSTVIGMRAGVNDLVDKPWHERDIVELVKGYRDTRISEIELDRKQAEEIKGVFIVEARALLEEIDEPILRIEKAEEDTAEVNALFRRIHTIKGSAGAVDGAKEIHQLAHAFESCLTAVKDGQLPPSTELTDLMLESCDIFIAALDALEAGSEMPNVDFAKEGFTSLCGAIDASHKVISSVSQEKRPKSDLKQREVVDEGVMVTNEKLDSFMELVGELVAFKNDFQGLSRSEMADLKGVKKQTEEMYKGLTKISDQLQATIMEVRKVTLHKVFSKFPRTVRQIAADQKKQIDLTIKGEEIEVDKKIAKALASSMIHIVRNSCDHGVETPEARKTNGKEGNGAIAIDAFMDGETIRIVIEDNGAGLNKELIVEKAIDKGIITEAQASNMEDMEIYALIFLSGFSTASKITGVSGRGVGMDVVKDSISSLGGTIDIDSTFGQGTKFTLKIPTPKTVIVEQVLVVKDKDIHLAIPLQSIADIKPLEEADVTEVNQGWTCQHRGITIPVAGYKSYIYGQKEIEKESLDTTNEIVVVISYKDKFIGVRADKIVDHVEAVVRPFDELIKDSRGFTGYTMLDDESVGYVLSTEEMIQQYEKIV